MAPMAHTPLESFLLLRALQSPDGTPKVPSFERASEALKADELLLQSDDRNEERLEPDRLKDLYLGLLNEETRLEAATRHASPARDANPRKRKLSSPPVDSLDDASTYAHLLPNLFERLYVQYKEDTIKAIEEEERQFRALQKEVQALELHTNEARAARPSSQGVPPISALLRETEDSARPRRPAEASTNGVADGISGQPGNLHADIYKPVSQSGSAENVHPPYLPPPPAPPSQNYSLPTSGIDRRGSISNQRHSSSPHARQVPLPQPERSPASPIILPPPKGMVRASGSPPIPSPQQPHYSQPRQSANQHPAPRQPYPYDNQAYYPPYGQTPVPIYHPHGGNMQPYHMPSVHTPYSPHYSTQSYQSPASSQHTAYYGPHSQYAASSQSSYSKSAPSYHDTRTPQASTTPRPPKLSPIVTKTSSTKWKKFDTPRGTRTPGSPIQPHSRDISPISDPGSDIDVHTPEDGRRLLRTIDNTRSESNEPPAHSLPVRRGRGGRGSRGRGSTRGRRGRAASSSTVAESRRSHSLVDDVSSVKAEPTTTIDDSASMASFTADEASRKSVRQRRGTIRSVETELPHLKRKRDEESITTTPRRRTQNMDSPALPPPTPHRQQTRAGYVLATRNFSRITAQLMNEISGHRLASLFAKPLTERDAPGYKNLILRPQDLKSIRGAISAGGRALTAHLEELGDSAGAGAHIWVHESEEFIPPKGIVNAAQLEKELMRLFANAVMFNPDTPENRGLGPAFRTRRRLKKEDERGEASSQDEAGENKFERGVAAPMEGDMVKDTRDVARDVQEAFAAWRAVEREREDDIAVVAGEDQDEGEQEIDEGEEGVKESVETEEEGGRRSKRRKR